MPALREGGEPLAHGERRVDRVAPVLGLRHGIVEEDHEPVAREVLDRAAMGHHQLADHAVVLAKHAKHLLRLGGLGEGGEPAQVTEERGDLAPMPGEKRLALVARQHARHLRCEPRQLGALPLDRLEQARVLDGQGGLVGERADQRDLSLAERANVRFAPGR